MSNLSRLNRSLDRQFYEMLGIDPPSVIEEAEDKDRGLKVGDSVEVKGKKGKIEELVDDPEGKEGRMVKVDCCEPLQYIADVKKVEESVVTEDEEAGALAVALNDGDEDKVRDILKRIDSNLDIAKEAKTWLDSQEGEEEEEAAVKCKACKDTGKFKSGKKCTFCKAAAGSEDKKEDKKDEVKEGAEDATVWQDSPNENQLDTPPEVIARNDENNEKVQVPSRIIKMLTDTMAQLEKEKDLFRYDEASVELRDAIINALDQIKTYLDKKSLRGIYDAQTFVGTLRNDITVHIPSQVFLFIVGGGKQTLGQLFQQVKR